MSAFSEDQERDMTDPEFAAEFERTTDEVRRERYAAAIAQSEGFAWDPSAIYAEDRDSYLQSADAAMAVADEEIRAAKLEGAQIVAANYVAERSRLRAELEEMRRKLTEASVCRRQTELDCAKRDRENARLRAELEESRRKECDALCSDVERDRDEYEATISRVRAVLDGWRNGDVPYPFIAVRDALNGES